MFCSFMTMMISITIYMVHMGYYDRLDIWDSTLYGVLLPSFWWLLVFHIYHCLLIYFTACFYEIVSLCVQLHCSKFKLACYYMAFHIGFYVILDPSLCVSYLFFTLSLFDICQRGIKGCNLIMIFTCIKCLMQREKGLSYYHDIYVC